MKDGVSAPAAAQADGDPGTRDAFRTLRIPEKTPDPRLMVPRGAVHILVRLLIQAGANPTHAITIAERWADGSDDPRYALLAHLIEEATR